jgi:hypothetical protein
LVLSVRSALGQRGDEGVPGAERPAPFFVHIFDRRDALPRCLLERTSATKPRAPAVGRPSIHLAGDAKGVLERPGRFGLRSGVIRSAIAFMRDLWPGRRALRSSGGPLPTEYIGFFSRKRPLR